MNYFQWLIDNNNMLYCFITFLGIGVFAFILVYFFIFIDYIIDKFKTIDKLLSRVEKLEKRKTND